MCGVAGYVDWSGAPPDEAAVTRMADLITHRGPDSSATRTLAEDGGGPTVVFGFRRLKIIDLSEAADQPMPNEDGSVHVVFNGEIYNFKELRHELEARDHTFRSEGDTEVIVHGYEEWGDAIVARLDGMFAFALWDGTRRRLLLARDRAGKKPLFYRWDGRRLVFGSEIKCIRAFPGVEEPVDWSRVPELLAFGTVSWPRTLHPGILQVPPASFVVLEHGALGDPVRYWDLRYAADGRSVSWREAAGEVRDRLREAVRRRLVSDVPLGVLLSGGLDSSAVVEAMSSLGVPVRTFTVGLEEEGSYDERRYARIIAERFGTEHTEVVVAADAVGLLEPLLWYLDQPFGDSSAIPTYVIARTAKEHVTVALTGDGGDEVFAGYERFGAALLADRVPGALEQPLGALARLLPRTGSYFDVRTRIERFSATRGRSPERRYRTWAALFGDEILARVLSPDLLSETRHADPFASFDAAVQAAGDVPLLHRLQYTNYRTYLHDDLLVKTDRMTSANSLEARSPFLDTDLLEYVASLPPGMKATSFSLKRLLRRALVGILPREILRRRKHGFGVPVDRWFRNELAGPFRELVLAGDARSGPALSRSEVERLFDHHLARTADHGRRLWMLLVLEVWLRMVERGTVAGPRPEPEILGVGASR